MLELTLYAQQLQIVVDVQVGRHERGQDELEESVGVCAQQEGEVRVHSPRQRMPKLLHEQIVRGLIAGRVPLLWGCRELGFDQHVDWVRHRFLRTSLVHFDWNVERCFGKRNPWVHANRLPGLNNTTDCRVLPPHNID